MNKKIVAVLLVSLLYSAVWAKKHIVGYYPTWKAHHYNPTDVAWDKITELDYSFYAPGPDGKLHVTGGIQGVAAIDNILIYGPTSQTGQKKCLTNINAEDKVTTQCTTHAKGAEKESLISIAHKNGVKVYASVGGWTLTKNFYGIAKSPAKTKVFVNQAIKLMSVHGFDGIDLDWEYPGTDGHVPKLASSIDKVNFVKLTSALRVAIDAYNKKTGKKSGLTAAVPCSGWRLGEGYDIPALVKNLDVFNLMAYDLHGPWEEKFGLNSPLYGKDAKDMGSASACVDLWLKAGVPKEKMNMGLAFYGRSWSGPKQADTATWSDGGAPSYNEIMEKEKDLKMMWDDQAKVPYATYTINSVKGELGFENPQSIAIKARYVSQKNLNGVLIWEITQDKMPDGSQPMLDSLNANLR